MAGKPLRIAAILAAALSTFLVSGARADFPDADCAECHGVEEEDTPLVTASMIGKSVHDGLACMECHVDIDDIPHADTLAVVDCGQCHEDVLAIYRKHGRAEVGVDPDIPVCTDCHGTHVILRSEDPESLVNPRIMPNTCGQCHSDTDLAREHDIRLKNPVGVYESSIHGQSLLGGKLSSAATCNDCHSTDLNAHMIFGPGDTRSTINHFNIPKTCGRCHDGIEEDYWIGIHGQLAARGETDTPVCTHCHGEHGILKVDDPRARVSPTQVAEATCSPCHESAFLNEKYGLAAGRLATFIDSYHGLKSQAGDTHVANCASCHGGHRILPSSDPRSSINTANLRETCGVCHPAITETLSHTKIHEANTGEKSGVARIVTHIYLVLIVLIIGFMLVYTALDWLKQNRDLRRMPQVVRMSADAVGQHTVLMVSFVLLVFTGFALRFNDWWIFELLFGWAGGFEVRGLLHRGAAIVFTLGCLAHLLFLRRRIGRQFLRDMWPSVEDARHMVQMIQYNLERRPERPKFGRFSFVEKLEYWALIWGGVVMFATGMMLWFDYAMVDRVPKGFLEVMLIIHFYEAILATLAIAIWHFYSTIFSPGVYPGNPSWITGKMPADMHKHEHPGEEPPPIAAE